MFKGWNIFKRRSDLLVVVNELKKRHFAFKELLHANNEALHVLADLEGKPASPETLTTSYMRSRVVALTVNAGVAPLARARHGDTTAHNDVADGIQIREPARRDQLEAALDETDGDVIAVAGGATEAAMRRLARHGFHVEPTSATVVAGFETYRENGVLSSSSDVVLPLTGRNH